MSASCLRPSRSFCIAAGVSAPILFKMDDVGTAQELHVRPPGQLASAAARMSLEVHRMRKAKADGDTSVDTSRIPASGLHSGQTNTFLKNLANFTSRMFVQACALSGCDYLESLPRVGLVTAVKLVRKFRAASDHRRLERVLRHLHLKGACGVLVLATCVGVERIVAVVHVWQRTAVRRVGTELLRGWPLL